MRARSTIVLAVALTAVLACTGCGDTVEDATTSRSPTATSTTATATTTATPPDDTALIQALVALAEEPSNGTVAALPFAAQVQLGLGPTVVATRSPDALRRRSAWSVDLEAFRGHVGPFNALDLIADHTPATGSLAGLTITHGEQPHCAGPPAPPPAGLADHRRLSVQPAQGTIDGCLEWFTVDLFLDDSGTITAVTLDLWEP